MDRITQQKVLMTMPRLINYSNAKLEHSISFFQTDLCITNSEVIQMIRQHPNILTHSINGKLKPLTQYFVDFGIAPSRWKKMLVRYPKITTVPIGKLGTRAKFLESALGLKGQLDISYVITGFPPTLWLGEENIMNKVYVLCRELELEEDDLRNIMVTYPNILGYSIENNILPKFQFLLGDFKPNSGTDVAMDQAMMGETCIGAGMTRQELKEFVLYQPSLLGYSLENRIRPRIAQMQQLSIRLPYAPLYLMSWTDVKFRKW
jgi:mTERF domain-containing protein